MYLSRTDALDRLRTCCSKDAIRSLESGVDDRADFASVLNLGDQGGRYCYLSRLISEWLSPFSACVLLITEYGIWPSRENQHLLHRLRLSYSEQRPVFLAPGHLFFNFETPDLATHLHLALLFGWGGIVANEQGKIARLSHDDWIAFTGDDANSIQRHWQLG